MSSVDAVAENWSFAVYVIGVLGICVVMLVLPPFLGGRASGRAKEDPFESGVVGQGSPQIRFSAKFYLVAMMFVIFDVEALFLYAWAVSLRKTGWLGYIEACTFILILLAGLYYLWKVGGLDWAPAQRNRHKLAHKVRPENS